MHRSAVIAVCVVIAAVAAGAVIWRFSQPLALPRASCGQVTAVSAGGGVTATDVITLTGNYLHRIVDRGTADGRIRWSQPATGFTRPAVTRSLVLLPDMPGTGPVLRARRLGSGRLVWQAPLPACLLAPPASMPGGTLIQSAGLGCTQTGGR